MQPVVVVSEQGPSSEKEHEMKTAIAAVMTLAVATIFGCQSPQGGGMAGEEGFKIGVPTLTTNIKQGDRHTVNVSLHRGKYFKQDVKLEITATKGITVEPTSVLVKASDQPEVQLQITAPKDAALSEYRVYLKGTPATGQPTSTDFTVKVVAP
jgi:uncharacterized membrane protein